MWRHIVSEAFELYQFWHTFLITFESLRKRSSNINSIRLNVQSSLSVTKPWQGKGIQMKKNMKKKHTHTHKIRSTDENRIKYSIYNGMLVVVLHKWNFIQLVSILWFLGHHTWVFFFVSFFFYNLTENCSFFPISLHLHDFLLLWIYRYKFRRVVLTNRETYNFFKSFMINYILSVCYFYMFIVIPFCLCQGIFYMKLWSFAVFWYGFELKKSSVYEKTSGAHNFSQN